MGGFKRQPSIAELVDQAHAAAQAVRTAHRALYGDGLPYDLFPAHWAFVGPTDLTREEFERRIHMQDEEWQVEEPQPNWQPWNPDEVVLGCSRVAILYESKPIGQEPLWRVADLRSSGDGHFTAGELMYKFYQAAAVALAGGDRQAFQGFEFVTMLSSYPEHLPLYQALLGG
jgi:hypothetical protein